MHPRKQYCILETVKVQVGHNNVKKRYDHLLNICKYAALKGGQKHFCCILKHFHVLVGLKTVLHLYADISCIGKRPPISFPGTSDDLQLKSTF